MRVDAYMVAAMQKDREAGMTIRGVAEKYGVSTNTVITYTDNRAQHDYQKEKWPVWDEWRLLNERYGRRGT